MFDATDSVERLSSKLRPRYFTFVCCLIFIPLYTVFKDLEFGSLWLLPNNLDFVLSCPKCYLENEKSFLDEIKNIFHSFQRAIIW